MQLPPHPTILCYGALLRLPLPSSSSLFRYPPQQRKGKRMNALKATQAFPPAVSFCLQPAKLPKWNKSTIVCCRSSSSSDGTESEPAGDGGGGDKRKQELLAKIAMLQAEKVRVTEFLDERSAYLTKFAEDANKEFDAVGEDALKELYEARIDLLAGCYNCQFHHFFTRAGVAENCISWIDIGGLGRSGAL